MSETASRPSGSPDPVLQRILVLQVAILIGIVIVFLQFDGIPRRVANEVPLGADNTGQIYQLQASIDALTEKVDALQATVEALSSPAP